MMTHEEDWLGIALSSFVKHSLTYGSLFYGVTTVVLRYLIRRRNMSTQALTNLAGVILCAVIVFLLSAKEESYAYSIIYWVMLVGAGVIIYYNVREQNHRQPAEPFTKQTPEGTRALIIYVVVFAGVSYALLSVLGILH